jgi:hypothetical protein
VAVPVLFRVARDRAMTLSAHLPSALGDGLRRPPRTTSALMV